MRETVSSRRCGNMKIMKKIHVVSECMRCNRMHPLTPFFVPNFVSFRVFRGKKWISLCLCVCG